MGLFKNLLESILGGAEDAALDAVKDKINDQVQETLRNPSQSKSTSASSCDTAPQSGPVVQDWNAYFREILRTEFSSYTVKENVPVTELVGYVNDEFKLYEDRPTQAYKAEWGKPYTFVLELMGTVKAVVMLGNGNSHSRNVKYLISRMYAKKLGVPYINFYTQMPNERDYVVMRIQKFLYL